MIANVKEIFKKKRRLENVLKTSWQDALKTSWRRMAKTNILILTKTSWRLLEDFFWRRKAKANIFFLIKTSSKDEDEWRLQDVFMKMNVCWEEGRFFNYIFRLNTAKNF